MTTSVLLVDDHELIRHGLAGAFTRDAAFTVAGQAGTIADALAVATAAQPDVVVIDLQLPDGSGLDLVRALRKDRKDQGLVVLTMYAGDEQIFAAMDAGASAFVGKDAPSTEVIGAARHAAVSPLSFTCAGLPEAMIRRMSSATPRLSDRERQVLDLLADGLGVAAIAGKLYISESTAKTHIAKVYEKLGAANRAQALVAAMRAGLIDTSAAPR
ncbi:MAG: two component transcriptional regulator, LuxR family [Marmoricola sp.]|nr:two component transcriptional regulator, LuxR family [Marmoricola sp.]MCW2857211.1 two component transcriptional regulator, LuxR family [Marmoricola sp.]